MRTKLIKLDPNSVFDLLRRRFNQGCDPDLDHAELFIRGGIVLPGNGRSGIHLMYSVQNTAFYARFPDCPSGQESFDKTLLTEHIDSAFEKLEILQQGESHEQIHRS